MWIVFALTIGIIFIMRAYYTNKHEYNVRSSYLKTEMEEYKGLCDKLKSLSPEQMAKLISDGEEYFKMNKARKCECDDG